jgi:hypothetical protein
MTHRTISGDKPSSWKDVSRSWPDLVPHVRRTWPELTYMEVLRVAGDRNRLCRLLAERYQIGLEDADDLVWGWQNGGGGSHAIDVS